MIAFLLALAFTAPPESWCGSDRPNDVQEWHALAPAHALYRPARALARALVRPDPRAFAKLTTLPLTVRYPDHYEDGKLVAWKLDVKATTDDERKNALKSLAELSSAPPKLGDDLTHIDVASTPTGPRVRICHDYRYAGDGIAEELELSFTRVGKTWRVDGIEIGWLELR